MASRYQRTVRKLGRVPAKTARGACPNCGEDASLRHDLCILALEVEARELAYRRARAVSLTALDELESAAAALDLAALDLEEAENCEGELPAHLRRTEWPRAAAA